MVKKKEVRRTRKGEKPNPPRPENEAWTRIRAEIIAVVMFMVAIFMLISIRKYQGMPDDAQFIGILGTYLTRFLQALFGSAALLAPVYLLLWAIHTALYKKLWSERMWGLTLVALTILVYMSVYKIPLGLNSWEAALKGMGGGYLGGGLAYLLISLLGRIGTSIVLVVSVLIAAIMGLDKSLSEIATLLWKRSRIAQRKIGGLIFYEDEPEHTAPLEAEAVIIHPESAMNLLLEDIGKSKRPTMDTPLKEVIPEKNDHYTQMELAYPARENVSRYVKPKLEMLTLVEIDRTIDKKSIKDSIAILEDTFTSFGISVKVNQVSCGPAVTRYELTPAPGVKVSKIISLSDDLQMNLAAPGIRIEAPIPGKAAIGIEVPSSKVSSVGLRNILGTGAFKKLNSPLAFALGEDIGGNSVVAKLSDMPHLLIAGSTGSGKSVCLNSIIMSMLYNASPEELKLVFIDPKMVELTVYNGIPHLMAPVVTDPKKASVVLRWMTTEMEKRYKLFADKGVRDIHRYNQAAPALPFIVIVIDELADLMMVAPIEVEDSICRLAQMARAAGIHLIVATQRPSVDVVTGIIKANIPSRIAFAVSSQTDSRTILDIGGAEKLLGKGDMLFGPVGAVKPYRVQGAFVSDRDIENTVNFIKGQLLDDADGDKLSEIEDTLDNMDTDYGDVLFWDAVHVVVENQKASVSYLQRKLRVGYARAARLMDLMVERGIVTEADHNKRREILIDAAQLEKLYANSKLC